MKKENKVIKFVKEHKKTVAIAGASILGIGAGVVAIILHKNSNTEGINLERPEIWFADVNEFWKYGDSVNMIFDNAKVDEIGKFGEALEGVEGITKDTTVSGVISFINKTEEWADEES